MLVTTGIFKKVFNAPGGIRTPNLWFRRRKTPCEHLSGSLRIAEKQGYRQPVVFQRKPSKGPKWVHFSKLYPLLLSTRFKRLPPIEALPNTGCVNYYGQRSASVARPQKQS